MSRTGGVVSSGVLACGRSVGVTTHADGIDSPNITP